MTPAPALTVLYVTNRVAHCMPGEPRSQYDLLAASLARQTLAPAAYELIVVDEVNELPRPELAGLLAPVRYLRPRDTACRRLHAFAPNSARNTGLVWARGATVAGLDDCFELRGDRYLERIVELAAGAEYAVSLLAQADASVAYPAVQLGPVPVDQYGGGVIAYSLTAALAVNGWDERFDGGSAGDIDMFARLRLAGVRFVRDAEVAVVGHGHAGRHTAHPRCWRLGWELAQRRRATTLRANEPWTPPELAQWQSCGRPGECSLTQGACDYEDAEPATTAALRDEEMQRPGFDLVAERARARAERAAGAER